MSTHTALVRIYAGGAIVAPGAPVEYEGPLNWKYQPHESVARARWDEEAADWPRVKQELIRQGRWDHTLPPDYFPPEHVDTIEPVRAPTLSERGYSPAVLAEMPSSEGSYDRYSEED